MKKIVLINKLFYSTIIVPIPSVVNTSSKSACFLRPSIIWQDFTPSLMALTHVSIFGIIPPVITPSSIKPGTSETLIFERENLVKGRINLPCVFTGRIVGGNVENKGIEKTYPIITVYDVGNNGKTLEEKSISFVNRKNGASVTFEYETCVGEILTIDFENRKAYSNINGDIMNYLSLENYLSSFSLDRGNNFIDVINNTSREISSVCLHDNYYCECL